MSRRVAGRSGRFDGGSEYSVSRTEVGAEKSRWVSKKPTDMNHGLSVRCAPRSASIVSGATSSALFDSTLITSS